MTGLDPVEIGSESEDHVLSGSSSKGSQSRGLEEARQDRTSYGKSTSALVRRLSAEQAGDMHDRKHQRDVVLAPDILDPRLSKYI